MNATLRSMFWVGLMWIGLAPAIAQEGESFDVLFWVGCWGLYDERSIETTQATLEVLEHYGVDYRSLGDGEVCLLPLRQVPPLHVLRQDHRHRVRVSGLEPWRDLGDLTRSQPGPTVDQGPVGRQQQRVA